MKIALVFVGVLVVVAAAFGWWRLVRLPILHTYDGKVVYTTDTDQSSARFERDCRARQGRFDACGTRCPSGTLCTAECAFVCLLP